MSTEVETPTELPQTPPRVSASDALIDSVHETLKAAAKAMHATADAHQALADALRQSGEHFPPRRRAPRLRLRRRA